MSLEEIILDDRTEYRLNGKLHNDNDLPAIVYNDGTLMWFKNGLMHRVNGPAFISLTGTEYWYQNGEYHRDNDLPAITWANGTRMWYQRGKLHRNDSGGSGSGRNDGPAIIDHNGTKYWYLNDKLHRDDGPAIVYLDGREEYYHHGHKI